MTSPRIKQVARLAVPVLTAGIFFLDWFTPIGVVDLVLYFIPLLLSFYANGRFSSVVLASVFSLLTVAGYYLSPSGLISGLALTNMLLGLGTLWVVAILLARLEQSMNETKRMSAAVEQSPVSIYITDLEGDICYVNPKFTEATGYALEEVAGKNPRFLKSGEMPREEYQRLWKMIKAGQEWRGTFHNRKKNGELYWASAFIAPVFNAAGQATHYVDVSEDITERKRVEDALRASESRYRSLFANMLNGYAYCQMVFEGDQPRDFIYLDVNAAFTKLTGLKDVVGRKATEVIPGLREADPELLAIYGRVARSGVPEQIEIFVHGLQMWFSISIYSPAKEHFVAVFDVITHRKRTEAALRESEVRFREMVECAEIAVFLSFDMKFTYLNPAALRLLGAGTSRDLLGQSVFSRIHPDYHEIVRKRAVKIFAGEKDGAQSLEMVYVRLDGSLVPVEVTASPFTFEGQRGAAVFVQDLTARKRAEQAHWESETQFRATFEQAALGMAQTDLNGHWLRVNKRFCDMVGYSREELLHKTTRDITHPDDMEAGLTLMRETLAGERETYTLEKRYLRKDQSIVPVNVTVSLLREASGKPKRFIVMVEDITERQRAEQARGESERKFRNLFESSQDAIMTSELQAGKFTSANPATVKMFGAKNEAELISHGPMELSPERQPDGRLSAELIPGMLEVVLRQGSHSFEWMHQRIGGETFLAEVHLTLITQNGKDQILGAVTDITARKQAEKALRESEERFREIAESIEEVFWVIDPGTNQMLYVSPAYEKIWGQDCPRLCDQSRSWLESIHSEDRGRVLQAMEKQGTPGAYDEEYRIVRPDGQTRWIKDKAFPVLGGSGQVRRVVGVARDITESRQLEDQFRQSQKMEAIGQLAGGVAHDFNNILGAMMLQAEMAEMVDSLPEATRESLHEIRAYAERAANLTRQLLLFSRRQVMQPRDLDLNEVVTNLAKMLQRIIGDDVRLQLHLNSAPLLTHSDAGMLDQVLMNLAVNSRDAMPKGGRLLIETAETILDETAVGPNLNVAPGSYVCLRVTDTGCGIPAEVLPRIFEPFFTTKEAGKGTGLGLATVFGIVKQHHGWVSVDSRPGMGTTFQILLPDGMAAASQTLHATAEAKPRGGTETILLVEDESAMRTLTCMILKRSGYKVLEAPDGRAALKLWQEHRAAVALLVTDLVMPKGVSGQELARQLQADQPQLKVLLMSGYSGEIAGQELQLRNGENFLQKPFATDSLLQTIRRCLDE